MTHKHTVTKSQRPRKATDENSWRVTSVTGLKVSSKVLTAELGSQTSTELRHHTLMVSSTTCKSRSGHCHSTRELKNSPTNPSFMLIRAQDPEASLTMQMLFNTLYDIRSFMMTSKPPNQQTHLRTYMCGLWSMLRRGLTCLQVGMPGFNRLLVYLHSHRRADR